MIDRFVFGIIFFFHKFEILIDFWFRIFTDRHGTRNYSLYVCSITFFLCQSQCSFINNKSIFILFSWFRNRVSRSSTIRKPFGKICTIPQLNNTFCICDSKWRMWQWSHPLFQQQKKKMDVEPEIMPLSVMLFFMKSIPINNRLHHCRYEENS